MTKVVKYLLISNILIFILTMIEPGLKNLTSLHQVGTDGYATYQWITYMFTHANFMHILFNMLFLFMFGPIVERAYGGTKFLIFYLVAGILAALVQFAFTDAMLLGASGSVFGVILASTLLRPHIKVYLFFIIPMSLWIGTSLILVYELYSAFFISDGVGHFAHLGGALMGAIFHYGGKWLRK